MKLARFSERDARDPMSPGSLLLRYSIVEEYNDEAGGGESGARQRYFV